MRACSHPHTVTLLVLFASCQGVSSAPSATAPSNPEKRAAPQAAAPAPPTDERSFDGLWSTNYGPMRLRQVSSHVSGTYSSDGAVLEGDIEGARLHARYAEPDGARGRALFELSEDGTRFKGAWREGEGQEPELEGRRVRSWKGERVVPVPGRVWLVVLEAYWEESLAEPEYSYGEMLRTFFARLPSVEVRHRFVHDREDLVRCCRELELMAEPIVLYVSSHGSSEGLTVGPDVIDGTTIGRALAGVENLRLVHLGSCDTLRGDVGAEIRAAASPSSFPVSGFTRTVDWAASAIVDLAYLDLVLEGELEPAEAVQAVRSMMSFAGQKGGRDDAFDATDLTILSASE